MCERTMVKLHYINFSQIHRGYKTAKLKLFLLVICLYSRKFSSTYSYKTIARCDGGTSDPVTISNPPTSSISKPYNTFGIFRGTSKYFANNFSSFPIYMDLFGTKPGGLLSENK